MSTRSTTTADRGMHAVLRVRDVRERDSRVGLVHALDGVRHHEQRLEALRTALADAQAPADGTVADFVVSRQLLATMAEAVRDAEQLLAASRAAATQAHERWVGDKARVRAVEHLLEVRADRRAEERGRAEVRETDDVVGALHSFRRGRAGAA